MTTLKVATTNQACWSLILLFVYYNLDRWMPLGGWNGAYQWPVRNDQFYLDLVVAVVVFGAIIAFRRQLRAAMILGTALLGLWTYFHLRAWWIPYLRGVTSPGAIAFHEQFLEHTRVLPRYGNHIPPDAEHTFIDVFVFSSFVLCLIATVRSFFVQRGSVGRAP